MAAEDVTIKYGADTGPLKEALADIRKQSAGLSSSSGGFWVELVKNAKLAGAAIRATGANMAGMAAIAASTAVAVGALAAAAVALVAALAAIAAAAAAVVGAVVVIRSSIAAALESEQANARLASAIENAGGKFEYTFQQLKTSARELSRQTIFSDEQIQAAQAVLIQYRLTGEQFRIVQRLAVDMASAMGTEPAAAASTLARALANPVQGIKQLRTEGVQFTTQATEQIKKLVELGDVYGAQQILLEQFSEKYNGAGQKLANTVTGSYAQIGNTIRDLQSQLGEAFLPYIQALIPIFRELAGVIEKFTSDWIKAFEDVSTNTTWIQEFQDTVITALGTVGLFIDRLVSKFRVLNAMRGNGTAKERLDAYVNEAKLSEMTVEEYTKDFRARVKAPPPAGGDGLPQGSTPKPFMTVTEFEGIKTAIADGAKGAWNMVPGDLQKSIMSGIEGAQTLRSASDETIARLAAGIDNPEATKGFKGGIEDSISTFRRIQAAVGSTEDVPKRQLSELEKLVLQENERRTRDDQRNQSLKSIEKALTGGVAAKAG